MKSKTETLQEYLARGGKITVCPTVMPKEAGKQSVKSTVAKPAVTIMTYEEANQYYGIKQEKKKSTKQDPKTVKKLEDLKGGIDRLPSNIKEKLGL